MRFRTLLAGLFLSLGWLVCWQNGAKAQAQSPSAVPLTVVSVSSDVVARQVTFTLRNDSDKAVTAWHVRYVDAAGLQKSGGFGSDAYVQYGMGGSRATAKPTRYIEPRGTMTATMRLSDGVDDVLITPVLAVWEDRTFVGSAQDAEFIFMRRAASRDAWASMVSEMENAIRVAGMSPDAFKHAIARVDAANAKAESAVGRNMRSTLSTALDDIEHGRATASVRLAGLLQHARQNLAVAAAHSR